MHLARLAGIDLNLLDHFRVVAEASSFTAAAEKLGVQASAISRAVGTLEEALGVELFTRTTRRVSLTPAGTTLHALLSPGLDSIRDALRSLRDDEEPKGAIRVTVTHEIASLILPSVLAKFHALHPRVQIELLITNQSLDLVAEGIDLAIRGTEPRLRDSSLVATRIGIFDVNVWAAPSYLARMGTPTDPAEAARHRWIGWRTTKLPPPFDVPEGKFAMVSNNALFVREAIAEGAGLGGLHKVLARDHVRAGKIVQIFPGVSLMTGATFVVSPPTRHTPHRVRALREHLVDHLIAEMRASQ
jgi:DNA-binding transcriptional LysR family regulator